MRNRKLRRLIAVAHLIRLTIDEHLSQPAVVTLRHESHNLLLVVVVNEGLHRLDRCEYRLPAK
jgi:hypothetical protein